MAQILVYDERLWGSPPYKDVDSTCLVNATHSMTSIISWLKTKSQAFDGYHTIYIMAHGDDGWIQLGKDGLHKDNVHLWTPLEPKVTSIVIFACNVAASAKGWIFCSRFAYYMQSTVTAADSKQMYVALPFGIMPTSFGNFEGTVHTWGADGNWVGSFKD